MTSVHLGYAVDDFHCLLDSELFLPESWSNDRERCRAAQIPESMVYRAKWRIALELYDRARDNGVTFRYLTFDEGYGGKPEFLRELATRGQSYVAEVPRTFTGWMHAPYVTHRPYRRGGGRGRPVPRLGAGTASAKGVERHLLESPAFTQQAWTRWHVKETHKGPMVWETKSARLFTKDDQGLPGEPLHLIVARNVCDPAEVKFFVSNASAETPAHELLLVAFSRWRVERCFEDQKTELGFDHFEGRSYVGLKRHQSITAVSHLFLSEVHRELRGKKSGTDRLPGPDGVGGDGAGIATRGDGLATPAHGGPGFTGIHPTTQRPSAAIPHHYTTRQTARAWHSNRRSDPMRMEHLAL